MSTTVTSIGEMKVQLDNACVSIIVHNTLRCYVDFTSTYSEYLARILNFIHTHTTGAGESGKSTFVKQMK